MILWQVSGVSEGDVIVTAPLPDLVANTPVIIEASEGCSSHVSASTIRSSLP